MGLLKVRQGGQCFTTFAFLLQDAARETAEGGSEELASLDMFAVLIVELLRVQEPGHNHHSRLAEAKEIACLQDLHLFLLQCIPAAK